MTILSILCLFFCAGITTEYFFHLGFKILLIASGMMMLLSVFFLRAKKVFPPVFYCLFFFAGALMYARAYCSAEDAFKMMRSFSKKDIVVYGRVAGDPYRQGKKTFFVLDSIYMHTPVCGACMISGEVSVEDEELACTYVFGQELVLKGRLSQRFRFARGLKKGGGAYIFRVKQGGLLWRHLPGQRNFFKAAAFSVKHKAAFLIARDMKPKYASFLRAMLLGERSGVSINERNMLIKIGVWHVLVVSGFHVVLIMSMAWLLLKVFLIPRRMRACFIILGLWFYCFLAGCSVSIVRAVVMSSFFLSCALLERKPHFYNTFFLAAFVIVAAYPFQLFDIGFQLSFLSVFFIVWLSPKLKNLFPSVFFNKKWSRCVLDYFCVAVSAWLGTSPVLAYYFGTFSWLAVLANMVIVPLSTLIVSGGFVLICLEVFCRPAAYFVARSNSFFISLFLKISYFLSGLPFGYVKGARVSFAAVLGCYMVIIGFGLFLKRRGKPL